MDFYYPSKSAVDNSQNGFQLLNNLMIPTFLVSGVLLTIQVAGQTVQLRINRRVPSIDQVGSLLPETIKRVEWIYNPGLIFNGANYVLNIIITNPTFGGTLMVMARPAYNQAWGFIMEILSLTPAALNGYDRNMEFKSLLIQKLPWINPRPKEDKTNFRISVSHCCCRSCFASE